MTNTIGELLARPCTAPTPGLAGYKVHGCRCHTCTTASLEHQTRRTRLIAYGKWQPFVDAAPARQHIRNLMAAGMGWQRVARTAGVAVGTVNRILYPTAGRPVSKRIRPATAAAILAVRHTPAAGACIDSTGTRRRTQALAALGWSISEQARRIGREIRNHTHHLHGTHVTAETARLVADLYERLSTTPAPDGRSKVRTLNWAAKQGWAPPLAWDDDTINDPDAVAHLGEPATPADAAPDQVVVERIVAGQHRVADATDAEQLEAVRRLQRRGMGVGALGRHLGVSGTAARHLFDRARRTARKEKAA